MFNQQQNIIFLILSNFEDRLQNNQPVAFLHALEQPQRDTWVCWLAANEEICSNTLLTQATIQIFVKLLVCCTLLYCMGVQWVNQMDA